MHRMSSVCLKRKRTYIGLYVKEPTSMVNHLPPEEGGALWGSSVTTLLAKLTENLTPPALSGQEVFRMSHGVTPKVSALWRPLLHLRVFWQLSWDLAGLLWCPTYWHDGSRRKKGHLGPLPPFKGQGSCPLTYPHVLLSRARSTCSPEPITGSQAAWSIRVTLRHVEEAGFLSRTRFSPIRERGG